MMTFPKIAVLIPAWNEERTITSSIHSIFESDYPIDQVLIVSDNSTDNTVGVVQSLRAQYPRLNVMETINNKARKSGALNQGIRTLGPGTEYVMILDADTRVHPACIKEGLKLLETDPTIGGICARTHTGPLAANATFAQKIWWHLQRLEYATADSYRVERLNSIQILAGSCVIYRLQALRKVAFRRGNGQFYDESSLIEDYELTISLKELGWKATIGLRMHSWTEVPLNLKVHWQQRMRWARSHVDTLREKGWNKITREDILGHIMFIIILPQQIFFLGLLGYLILTGVEFTWNPLLWVILGLNWLNRMYRLKYIPDLKVSDVLIRASFIPEEVYGLWHSVQQVWAYWLAFTNGPEEWQLT